MTKLPSTSTAKLKDEEQNVNLPWGPSHRVGAKVSQFCLGGMFPGGAAYACTLRTTKVRTQKCVFEILLLF